MKVFRNLIVLLIFSGLTTLTAQSSCSELMEIIKSKDYGTTYNSYTSDAISKVTFYSTYENYKTYYFAVVCFKKNSYNCNEYLYQVASNTKMKYAMNFRKSAGEAFWKYIQPYNQNLNCAPN